MNNQIVEFEYNNQVVEFDLTGDDVFVNATEMAKPFGKRPVDFLKQKGTEDFIEALKKSLFPEFRSDSESLLNAENKDSEAENTVRSDFQNDFFVRTVKGKASDGGETWMHRMVALKFASWLSPEFEVWVYNIIHEVLYGKQRQNTDLIREKAKLMNERSRLISKLSSNEDFQQLQQVEGRLSRINRQVSSNNMHQLNFFSNPKSLT